ncbi:MAG TPA: YggS family pyridoxal phosphate-dependent enzyme [Gemmatimonadales bacterium]|nr:YggS family pyridoxal phosphate-dependent enzyme [Gemmatimonadales bacterium]
MEYPGLPGRLERVQATIAEAQAAGGWHHPVTIVAVTKTHGPDAVRAAALAGLRDVGENRVQEALPKQDACIDVPVVWHLIGSLQRNKARQVVGRFGLIHSVDRLDLGQELARRAAPGRQAVLVQVNCSDEPQKGGVAPTELPRLLDDLLALDGLELRGLMTMAALTADVRAQRAAFHRLRELRDDAERRGIRLPELSMGMSGDYAVAVESGATMVRLGTILFGGRTP